MRSKDKETSLHKMMDGEDREHFYMYTSYHNAKFKATLKEIKQLFGKPTYYNCSDKSKYDYRLLLIGHNEGYRAITIYDYKFNGKITNDTEVEWHIGGNGERETFIAKEIIEDYLEDFRNGNILTLQPNIKMKGNLIFSNMKCPLGKISDTTNKIIDVGTIDCVYNCGNCEHFNIKERKVICRKQ